MRGLIRAWVVDVDSNWAEGFEICPTTVVVGYVLSLLLFLNQERTQLLFLFDQGQVASRVESVCFVSLVAFFGRTSHSR